MIRPGVDPGLLVVLATLVAVAVYLSTQFVTGEPDAARSAEVAREAEAL